MARIMIVGDNEGLGISRAALHASSYPGGPRVSDVDSANSPQRLKSGEDVEEYREAVALRIRRSRRSWRLRLGIAATTLIAILGGVHSGMRSHRTAEQLAAAVQSGEATADLTRETRRLINELWKMEDLERHPRLGR